MKLIATSLFFVLCSFFTFSQTEIEVLSAVVKDKKIEGAEVLLQKNGEQTVLGVTDVNGKVRLNPSFADDPNAIVIIKKDGYSTLVAKCPCEGLTYAISPVMNNLDGLRIVLNWGEYPEDLDSHLWYGNEHIFFEKQVGEDANLDVDDVDSYGPETITIENRDFSKEYTYSVHDFTNRERQNSTGLSNSGAKVFVYIGQSLVRTFYVPQNKVGNLWTVFKITKDGEIQDINSFTNANTSSAEEIRPSLSNAAGSLAQVNKAEALRLNDLGTKEYQKNNYDKAIEYYTQAINIYPNFGQAYGNLGLTYKKNGQYAEALWANRKAISLASGNSAATTRAGAYYNIGRIYEERGEYAKAKEQYQQAKAQVDKPTYTEAIQRMNQYLR